MSGRRGVSKLAKSREGAKEKGRGVLAVRKGGLWIAFNHVPSNTIVGPAGSLGTGAPPRTRPDTGLFYGESTLQSIEAARSVQQLRPFRDNTGGGNGQRKPRGGLPKPSAKWDEDGTRESVEFRNRARQERQTIDLSFGDLR